LCRSQEFKSGKKRYEEKPSNKQLKKDLIELARNLRKSYQDEQ